MVHNIPARTGLRQERSKFSEDRSRPRAFTAKRVRVPPFVRGQTIDIIIEEIGHNGDGIAHEQGFTVLVPNTQIGERVKAKVWRVQRTLIFTKRVEKGRLAPGKGEQLRVPRAARSKVPRLQRVK